MGFDIAPYSGAISSVSDFLGAILKRVLPEKVSEEIALKLQQELMMALVNGELQEKLGQMNINAKEAESDNLFVAGWRPFIGWTCGSALAYQFVVQPVLVFGLRVAQVDVGPLPILDYASLSTVLMGMLGLGAMRSYEKIKGETTTATRVGS